jgi:hypothetical protein
MIQQFKWEDPGASVHGLLGTGCIARLIFNPLRFPKGLSRHFSQALDIRRYRHLPRRSKAVICIGP